MANVNAAPIKFDVGGTIVITSSAAVSTLLNKRAGTLKVNETTRERIEYKDAGAVQTPIAGDEQYPSVEFSIALTKNTGSGELLTLARTAGTNGVVKTHDSIVISAPSAPNSSTGYKWTLSNFWFEGVPQVSASGGKDLDVVGPIVVKCLPADFVAATY